MSNPSSTPTTPHATCPIDHSKLSAQKTGRESYAGKAALEQDAKGDWQVYGYQPAKLILRSGKVKQAGFQADEMEKLPSAMRDPILFQEGKTHREQRVKTAKFFTPRVTDENYRVFMNTFADKALAGLISSKRADLSQVSLQLAVDVAAQVVGLNHSRFRGMAGRLEAFFTTYPHDNANWIGKLRKFVRNQASSLQFFLADVQPAIAARKKESQEDLITHLISEGYTNLEILIECITFAAAGMVTTREFISVCAWHLFSQVELKEQYLAADQKERYKILHELLRLESVVGHLYRRATDDITIELPEGTHHIKAGERIVLHVYGHNVDEQVVGEAAQMACPVRNLPKGVGDAVMSFGDGNHRCPGAYIAIQETDIFLQKLFQLDGLHMIKEPNLSWNDLVKGYELRDFQVGL
ncbi:MAG: cytochrome P450 [Bacteroidota bacterium]